MRCSKCGSDNIEGTKFCGQCGSPLEINATTVQQSTSDPDNIAPITAPVAPVSPALVQKTRGMGIFDSLWVMGAALALIALFCPNKMIAAILAIIGLIMLVISGIGLLKTKTLKGSFVLALAGIVLLFTVISMFTKSSSSGTEPASYDQPATQATTSTTAGTTKATTVATTESTTASTSQTATSSDSTSDTTGETSETRSAYEENDYYSIIETGSYKSSSYHHVIHKVKAKVTCRVEVSAVAYDKNGDVIDTASDGVVMVKGMNNFFRFSFTNMSDKEFKVATIEYSASLKSDLTDTTRATDYEIRRQLGSESIFEVELVKQSHKKNYAYLTFEYKQGTLNFFDRFKILYYKGNKIVGYEDGYFSVYADGLNNIGDKSVVKMYLNSSTKKYDRLEYYFEPSEY